MILVIALRIALPSIVRSQIEKQASAAIVGQLTVGDVDLWVLLGGVALKDVVLRAENTAPDAPPVVAFKRLYVQVGYPHSSTTRCASRRSPSTGRRCTSSA